MFQPIGGVNVGTILAKELEELFNVVRAPEAASRNLLRRMGLNLTNPFSARTAGTLSQLGRMSTLSQIIRGQMGTAEEQGREENLRNLLQSLMNQAESGNILQYPDWNKPAGAAGTGGAGLVGELNALLRNSESDPGALNSMQTGLATRFAPNDEGEYNQNEILAMLQTLSGAPSNPFGSFLQNQGLSRKMRDFTDYIGASNKNRGILDYLTGSMSI